MTITFKNDKVIVNMYEYIVIETFVDDESDKRGTPTLLGYNWIEVDKSEIIFYVNRKENYHTIVAKRLFACKRA